ncbi:hypothetical protein [Streptomyces smyrnaeus]|uniref:hypothetical protein n=1 Tax=Streptomyces smyrnaeus TaxID=1387713 RepID=UPI0033D9C5E6
MSQSRIRQLAARRQSTPIPSRRTKKSLVVAVGIGMAVALSGCNDDTGKASDKDSDAAASKTPSESSKPAAPESPSGDQPAVAGWQTQTSEKHHFRYDVPAKAKKWKILPEETALSYLDKKGKPIVVMTAAANYREGGCPSSPNPKALGEAGKGQLATVGTTGGGKEGSLQENARNWAGNWGFAAYGGEDHKPKIKVSKPKPWKHGGIDGYTATAEVTVTNRPGSCVPPKAVVHSIAQKLPDGTMHGWVIYADQGVPKALSGAEIKKIMSTVRATGD